ERPLLPRLELDGEMRAPAVDLERLRREEDLRPSRIPVARGEDEAFLRLVRVCLGLRRQGPRVERVAEREVVLLDREDVCEVRGELDLDRERERPGGVAAHDHEVLHALADVAGAGDRHLVPAEAAGDRVSDEERGGERLALNRREEERPDAVHGQDAAREEAGVLGEETRGPSVNVPPLVADAERRAVQDRKRHEEDDSRGSGLLEPGKPPSDGTTGAGWRGTKPRFPSPVAVQGSVPLETESDRKKEEGETACVSVLCSRLRWWSPRSWRRCSQRAVSEGPARKARPGRARRPGRSR